jgi:hypothetical protein
MGSAVTFPVQTYVFAMIAIGTLLYFRGVPVTIASIRKASQEVRVFGDDIIVPNTESVHTQEILVHLGFKVNQSKTFWTGKFRESCGMEAYDGHDVSRVSVLTTPDVTRPESIVSSVDSHNNFFNRGYLRTAEFIKSTVRRERGLIVPDVAIGSGAFGFSSMLGPDFRQHRWRVNQGTQAIDLFCTRLISKTARKSSESNSMLLQYFTEALHPPRRSEERLGVASRSALKLRGGWVALADLYS